MVFLAGNLYPLLAGRHDLRIVGGAEVQQLLLARELRRLGCDLRFVVEDLGQGARCVVDGFAVHGYVFSRNKLRQARTLWRALRTAQPELIYVRGAPRFLAVVLAYCRWHRSPLVLGLSTNRQVYPRDPAGRGRWDDLVYRQALRDAAEVIAQTRFQAEQLGRCFGRQTVRVIRNGIDLTPAAGAGSPREVVAWIGSLHPHKGVERLLELARRLPELRFEVVGGPARNQEAYYAQVEVEARRWPNVRWRGFLPHDQVDEVLQRAFALVQTTVSVRGVANLEGFPNVYLEAWRQGVPTFTLENDPDELIQRHGLGRHCRDLAEMAVELQKLAGSPATRAAIGEAAQAYLAREHDIRDCARRYAELFAEVAARPSRRPPADGARSR